MATSALSPTVLSAAERRGKVWELRKSGATLREISDVFGVSITTVHKDIRKVYQSIMPHQDDVNLTRRLELERLDRLLRAIWPSAISGHLGTIDRVLKIINTRANILPGLKAPQPVAPVTPDGKEEYTGGVLVVPGMVSPEQWLEMVGNQVVRESDFNNGGSETDANSADGFKKEPL